MHDFSTYLFRCSGLHNLMVAPRSKTEILSETTKSYLRELWIKEVFGREKFDTTNKYTNKGVRVESDALDLVQKVTGETYFKNQEQLSNEWISGTPDIICKNEEKKATLIKDIKASWDIWTFNKVDETSAYKAYFYQVLGYMWLTGAPEADLMYCLCNTPEDIIESEMYHLSYKYPELGSSEGVDKKFRMNYIFDDIAPELRMKSYRYQTNSMIIEEVKVKISAAREYMKGLSL